MRRLILASALLALLALASPAALGQALPDRIKAAGKLVIATQPNYAPIAYKDPANNTLTGFDIELGEAIAAELGVKVEWQETAFAQMLPSLQTGRVDMAMAGMSDLPSRREVADFVDYMVSGAQFYTHFSLKDQIKTPEDLCGKSVGASRSTNWPQQIGEWSQANCVAKGKPAINVVGTEGSVDARNQIKTQRLQGGVQGSGNDVLFPEARAQYLCAPRPPLHAIAGRHSGRQDRGRRQAARCGQGRDRAAAGQGHL